MITIVQDMLTHMRCVVDRNAIGAAKIAHDQGLSDLGDAAMTARNLGRFELDVAFRIPAQKQDGFVQKNAGSAVDGLELRRHRNAHSDESCTTSASYIGPQ